MASQSSFKAKLLTATGDQISKTIKTIDKNDIKSAFTSISSRFKKPVKTVKDSEDLVKKDEESEKLKELSSQDEGFSSLKDRRGESGNYKSFEYIDYDKDAKVIDGTQEIQKSDVDPELGEDNKLIEESTTESKDDLNGDLKMEDKKTCDNRRGSGAKNSNSQAGADIASFVQKKNVAQGMMDLALVSANTNQLRYVMDMSYLHPYFYTSMALIITSLALQLCVGLGLFYTNGYNLRRKSEMKSATRWNDVSTVGVFLITLINVFISTFNGTNLGSKETNQTTTIPPNNC